MNPSNPENYYNSLFTFLTRIEWFNGVAFGIEPYGNGAGALSINSLSVAYS